MCICVITSFQVATTSIYIYIFSARVFPRQEYRRRRFACVYVSRTERKCLLCYTAAYKWPFLPRIMCLCYVYNFCAIYYFFFSPYFAPHSTHPLCAAHTMKVLHISREQGARSECVYASDVCLEHPLACACVYSNNIIYTHKFSLCWEQKLLLRNCSRSVFCFGFYCYSFRVCELLMHFVVKYYIQLINWFP